MASFQPSRPVCRLAHQLHLEKGKEDGGLAHLPDVTLIVA
jgi:hypothetical protein